VVGVAEGLSWGRAQDTGETKHTRLKAITSELALQNSFMGGLLTFCPSIRDGYPGLKRDHPVDQQDDIAAAIAPGQTNRFSAMNKNRLAKYNFWCA
jgi:hypothetical protein